MSLVVRLIKRSNDLEYDLLCERNHDKFSVLEQVKEFLDKNGIFWEHLFQPMRKSERGFLHYNFGGFSICFQRSAYLADESDDLEEAIDLSIESEKDTFGKRLTYKYTLKELSNCRKTRQSKIGNNVK